MNLKNGFLLIIVAGRSTILGFHIGSNSFKVLFISNLGLEVFPILEHVIVKPCTSTHGFYMDNCVIHISLPCLIKNFLCYCL
jgi:hypothetical protein